LVKSTEETKEKVVLTTLASIFSKSSLEIGKAMLDFISELIYSILLFLISCQNLPDTLNLLISLFSPKNRSKIFSASRTSCNNNFPKETKHQLDQRMQHSYQQSLRDLNEINAKSKEIMFSIDTSSDLTSSKYLNDQYSFSVVGQQTIWKRAFTYSGIYDNTHQLFISFKHQNYHKSKHKFGDVQDFIKQIQEATKTVYNSGSRVKFINADRGYYDAELFAAAHLNEISALCPKNHKVSVITPKILYKNKEGQKRMFLENGTISQVNLTTLGLSKYTHPALIEKCKQFGLKPKDSIYRVPVVEVVLVDEYSKKTNRSVEDIRQEWKRINSNLTSTKNRLKILEIRFLIEQIAAGISDPKPVPTKGKYKRKNFRTRELKWIYDEVKTTRKYLKKLNKQKTKCLKALSFFTISITAKDVQNFKPAKFIQLAKLYHERWGIENGFRDEKMKFLGSCRLRKSTGRQYKYLIGLMLYNDWHVQRMKEMLQKERKRAWNKKPYDPRRPYLRRKFEQKYCRVLSAESYLLQTLFAGLKQRLSRIMSEVIKND